MELLHKVVSHASLFTVPAKDAVRMLLTFGDRVPIQNRVMSLAAFDKAVFDLLPASARLTAEPAGKPDQEDLRLYFNGLGRLHIRRASDDPVEYGTEPNLAIGYLALDREMILQADAAAEQFEREEALLRRELDAALFGEERAGALPALLDAVEDSVRHVEAVCFYVDDRLYAVMERGTNLVTTRKRPGLMEELRKTPVSAWESGDRLAIAGLRALYLSGRSIRFEEFNAIELTAHRLRQFLHGLGALYSSTHPALFEPSPHPFELGRQVGELAQTVNGGNWLRYRRVNGITFQKQEHCVRLAPDHKTDRAVDASFELMRSKWNAREADDPRLFFTEVAENAIEETCRELRAGSGENGQSATTTLERLIEDVVGSAVQSTNAEYGMSSSLRRPGQLFVDDPDSLAGVVATLTPKDFFCCIVGSSYLARQFGPRLSGDVLRAVQARMQFNRWHFIPGNFPRSSVPDNRHYFYPPTMPDLAEWVDQFHAGHIRAAVRYSIRSPGPEILDVPLRISGHEFRGFYDVRVVRIEGAPFTIEDLRMVRVHSIWMGHIWRTILARCADAAVREQLHIVGFENGYGAVLEEDEAVSAIA
jgi:hypothetical protein